MIGEAGRRRAGDWGTTLKVATMRAAFALELPWRLAAARVLEPGFQRAPASAVEGRNWRARQAGGMDAAEGW